MSRPTKEQVRKAINQVDEFDLPDGAYWARVHEILGLPYGDVFDYIAEDPEFFGATETT